MSETLKAALERTYRERWANKRDGGRCLLSQAEQALLGVSDGAYCREMTDCGAKCQGIMERGVDQFGGRLRHILIEDIQPGNVKKATARWYAEGLAPSTINKRLSCLSVMGIDVGKRERLKPALKWWLRPEEEEKACCFLLGLKTREATALCSYIQWTTLTGLRLEETLRLTRKDFAADFSEVTVPGLKTHASQATLALGSTAAGIAKGLFARGDELLEPDSPMFNAMSYAMLLVNWNALREEMEWPADATLKALRRSAARYLHVECGMPLHMVQQYLRHESMDTTLGYLKLVGGYGVDEQRRFLK